MDAHEKRQFIEDVIQNLMQHHEGAHILNLADERLVGTSIRIASDDGNWLEMEILDSKTGQVRLTNGETLAMRDGVLRGNDRHMEQPVEGHVVGSRKVVGPLPSHDGNMQILDGVRLNPTITIPAEEILPLIVKQWHAFFYRVGDEQRVLNGACAVIISLPSGKTFDLWEEP